MTKNTYAFLIETLCASNWLHDAQSVMKGGAIEVNGNKFTLLPATTVQGEEVHLYCDCGPATGVWEKFAYELALKKNLSFFQQSHAPLFSIVPDTGHVVLVQREPLEQLTPTLLINKLVLMSAQAKIWREELYALTQHKPNKQSRFASAIPQQNKLLQPHFSKLK